MYPSPVPLKLLAASFHKVSDCCVGVTSKADVVISLTVREVIVFKLASVHGSTTVNTNVSILVVDTASFS